ncbi:hypothetical protein K439DRAFT_1624153 [Ramaria rubella]|nr:hypothetical protein K439DRAFT_1624153 [Ramaria rubella]
MHSRRDQRRFPNPGSGRTAISLSCPNPLSTWLKFTMEIEQGDFNVEGDIMAVHSSPLFHALGLCAAVWPAVNLQYACYRTPNVSGYTRAAPSPRVSTPPMTPESFLEQIVDSQATLLLCVPSFLESWAANSSSVQAIKRLKAIIKNSTGVEDLWNRTPVYSCAKQAYLSEHSMERLNLALDLLCQPNLTSKATNGSNFHLASQWS